MTLKEELLNINSYEEYIAKRERFRDLQMDEEIIHTIDTCIKMNKSFWEWHGRDPDVTCY